MTSMPVPSLCESCKRRTGLDACTAFPGGIPVDILASMADHRKPYPGDYGKLFVEDPERNANLPATLQILDSL